MTTPTITIDMDKECSKCHEMGAVPNGLCLSCTAELLAGHSEVEIKNALRQVRANKDGSMLGRVSFDGIVSATSTNWPKHETRIGVAAMYSECGEIEADSLGAMIRDKTAVDVAITDKHQTGEMIEFRASIEGVRTDWANAETTVTFKVSTPSREFESRSSVLGVWGERSLVVTIVIVPVQGRLI